MIEEARGRIDYEECGDGPTIVLVPGSCSTGAAWRPVIAAWNGRFRCVTTSLLGYGGTAERRSVRDPSISHEAEALESVVRKAGRVHLVGHSFGGLVALSGVDMQVGRGEIFGLVGPNGSGKTTLTNAITGFYPPQAGRIFLNACSAAV